MSESQLRDLADLVADRLVDRLAASQDNRLVDASGIARRYGVTRSWCYEHAAELGAIRIGNGSRPRLRFSPEAVERYLAAGPPSAPTRISTPRRRNRRTENRTAGGAPLLEVQAA